MVTSSPEVNNRKKPYKLTPAIHKAIVEHVKQGNWVYTAAKAVGISRRTVMTWMQIGRGEHPTRESVEPYTSFAADVEEAFATGEIEIVKDIRQDGDWRAKAWLLERGPARDRWSQNTTVIAALAPAASILDTLRQRALDSEEGNEPKPLEVEVRKIEEVSDA